MLAPTASVLGIKTQYHKSKGEITSFTFVSNMAAPLTHTNTDTPPPSLSLSLHVTLPTHLSPEGHKLGVVLVVEVVEGTHVLGAVTPLLPSHTNTDTPSLSLSLSLSP